MKKKLFKGAKPAIFMGLLFSIIPIFVLAMLFLTNNENFYLKNNRIYGETKTSISVANIEKFISYLGESSDGTADLSLVQTNGKIVVLESEKNNADFQMMVENPDILKDKPVQIVVKRVDRNITEFVKQIDLEQELKNNIAKREYISSLLIKRDSQNLFFLFLIVLTIPLLLISLSIYRVFRTKKAYDTLFEAYPELEENLDLIRTQSDLFYDGWNVAIYKNHFILFSYAFDVIDIRDIKKITFIKDIINLQKSLITYKSFTFEIINSDDEKINQGIKWIKEEPAVLEQKVYHLFTVMKEKNPSIELNY